jgi:ligand-binding SRPBCC domain-containing protein
MKIYTVTRKQFLPITSSEAWNFFSAPANLSRLTPSDMHFVIHHISGGCEMYAGQIMLYSIKILPAMTVQWMTEITHMKRPTYFVDEQRLGPYALWHHQHHFREVPGGVEMTDEVSYGLPLGFLGKFANWLFVEQRVNAIFDYRFNILRGLFAPVEANVIQSA